MQVVEPLLEPVGTSSFAISEHMGGVGGDSDQIERRANPDVPSRLAAGCWRLPAQ